MAYITIEQAKKQCNIENCFVDDDDYFMNLIAVAANVLEKDLCHVLVDFEDGKGNLPPALTHAMLLLVAHYYANREPVAFASSSNVPLTYRHLIGLYFDYSG